MIAARRVFVATLAAGLARRFGGDKLAQPYGRGTVLEAALAPLDAFGWLGRIIVVQEGCAAPGSVIVKRAPERGMGHSLALAARAAQDVGAEFLLVTLGDMPQISAASLGRLLEACPDRDDALASLVVKGALPGPPAVFGKSLFSQLGVEGADKGARDLLRDPANRPVFVDLPAGEAADIDTPADLEHLRRQHD